MQRLMERLRIAAWAVLAKRRLPSNCPCCRGMRRTVLGRVRVVFDSARCADCGLVYRIPTQSPPSFYATGYLENTVWWRDYRSGALARDAACAFRGTKWDYYDKISLLQHVHPSGMTLDFGGGSGVIAYQLQQCGFDVDMFELSRQSGAIASELLKVRTITDLDVLSASSRTYDIIVLHHVLEHVADLQDLFALLHRLLAPDGILWIFVPNGGAEDWRDTPQTVLDSAHVCAFEPAFFERNLARFGFNGVAFSTPYAFVGNSVEGEITRTAQGRELAVVAWKSTRATPLHFERWPYDLPDLSASLRAQAGC